MRDAARRLERLELHYRIDTTEGTPRERATRAVERGLANQDDFRLWLEEPWLGIFQAIIVARSQYFRAIRETGWEPWNAWPWDVAADIAAIPLGQSPSQRQMDIISWHVGQQLIVPKRLQQSHAVFRWKPLHRHWMETNSLFLALGDATGITLREQIAAGAWDGSTQFIHTKTPFADMTEPCHRSCRPWHPIPGFMPPVPPGSPPPMLVPDEHFRYRPLTTSSTR